MARADHVPIEGDGEAEADGAGGPLLAIEDLHVEFGRPGQALAAVQGLGLSVGRGETVAVVGESGSGKTVTALAVLRLLPAAARITRGRVLFKGRDLLRLSPGDLRRLRGREIGMVFQEPMTSLNPVLRIGLQIAEPLQAHLGMGAAQARARAIELLGLVGIPDAERRLDQYPHQLSGGMRQRVMIAIALACNPSLIIADEPTTALDVTIQAQILELMKDLSRRLGIALLIITHNLGIVARYADRVVVMYAGRPAESGGAEALFARPRHPYTVGLLRSVPRLDRPRGARLDAIEGTPPAPAEIGTGCPFAPRCPLRVDACAVEPPLRPNGDGGMVACHRAGDPVPEAVFAGAAIPEPVPPAGAAPILAVEGLTRHFAVGAGWGRRSGTVRAVEGVSFHVLPGETLGLVGESGCGKTTVGRMVLRLDRPTAGTIRFDGVDLAGASAARMKAVRRRLQVIFQDPYTSLNPRLTVGDILAEPIRVHRVVAGRRAVADRVAELLGRVGLRPDHAGRYPHQLSGGQRQRVGIARALAVEPAFIVCDEAVSALDVSIQGQIVNLLEELRAGYGLAYLFIAHDLAVVRHIATRVMVMYLGRVMEVADRDTLYAEPLHPYTRGLLEAAPVPDPVRERARAPRLLQGDPPSPLAPPPGCVFSTRCPLAGPECRAEVPPLRELRPGHRVACLKA